MLESWAKLLHRKRAVFLALWLLCIAGSALFLPGLQFEFSLRPLLKGDGAEAESVREFYKTFPPAEGHAVVGATWDEPVTVNQLRQAREWAKQLERLPEVRKIYSPASILDMKFQGFTVDEWARLGGDGTEPITLGSGPGMGTIKGRFISHDFRSIAFHVQKERGSFSEFSAALREASEGWGRPVRVVGPEVVLSDMVSFLRADLVKLLLLELMALLVVLPLFFRSFRTAYIPVLSAITGLILYFAVLSIAGQAIGLIYLAGPVLIVVIGLSDSIHLQQHFDDARAQGSGVVDSLVSMYRNVGTACVLTSLTTAIGFLSLYFAGHPEVSNFGLWCAIGVCISFFAVVLFLPVALALFPGKTFGRGHRSRLRYASLRRFAVPAAVVLVAVASGIAFIKVNSSITQEVPEDTQSVQDLKWFAENFRGTTRVEVDLVGPLDDPEVFAAVGKLQEELEKVDGVVGSISYVDMIRFFLPPKVVESGDGPYLGLRSLGGGDDFPRNLLTRSGDRGCLVFYTSDEFGSHQFGVFEERFAELARDFPEQAEIHLSGYLPMAYRNVNLVIETLFKSFGISLVAITLVLAVALRSPLLAILCLVPNAFPILVAAGFAGWVEIPLRMGIVIIFSVGLGLAVDDTIHLVVRFRQLRQKDPGGPVAPSLDASLKSAGFAVVLTSVVLLIAAAAFTWSKFSTMRDIGFILAAVTLAALIADLLIFPWLIEKFTPARAATSTVPKPVEV